MRRRSSALRRRRWSELRERRRQTIFLLPGLLTTGNLLCGFYAIVLTLALMGMDQPVNVWLAWGYVGLRILHSLIQCTTNIVKYRFPVFALASLCLLGLTVHAGARILHDCLGWHLF